MKTLLCFYSIIFALLASGCSSYSTNTDVSFEDTQMQDRPPVMYVGEVSESVDQFSYLGISGGI